MKALVFKPQVVGIWLLLLFALIAGGRMVRGNADHIRKELPPIIDLQVDLISQQATTQGQVISVNQKGAGLMKYVCKPMDAAVAVITSRNRRDGTDVRPTVLSATDPTGQHYQLSIRQGRSVSLLIVQREYSRKPKSITVQLNAMGIPSTAAVIKIDKISEPIRFLNPPTGLEARSSERVAQAFLDDDDGQIKFNFLTRLSPNEGFRPHVLETSFSSVSQLGRDYNEILPYVPFGLRRDTNTVKVKLDRNHFTQSFTTLVYKHARIVNENGLYGIDFPNPETIGSIGVLTAGIGVIHPNATQNGSHFQSEMPEEMFINLSPPPTEIFNPASVAGPAKLKIVDIFPSPESMGLTQLKVSLNRPYQAPEVAARVSAIFKAKTKPTISKGGIEIPELKVKVEAWLPTTLSSQTLVLPIHHLKNVAH